MICPDAKLANWSSCTAIDDDKLQRNVLDVVSGLYLVPQSLWTLMQVQKSISSDEVWIARVLPNPLYGSSPPSSSTASSSAPTGIITSSASNEAGSPPTPNAEQPYIRWQLFDGCKKEVLFALALNLAQHLAPDIVLIVGAPDGLENELVEDLALCCAKIEANLRSVLGAVFSSGRVVAHDVIGKKGRMRLLLNPGRDLLEQKLKDALSDWTWSTTLTFVYCGHGSSAGHFCFSTLDNDQPYDYTYCLSDFAALMRATHFPHRQELQFIINSCYPELSSDSLSCCPELRKALETAAGGSPLNAVGNPAWRGVLVTIDTQNFYVWHLGVGHVAASGNLGRVWKGLQIEDTHRTIIGDAASSWANQAWYRSIEHHLPYRSSSETDLLVFQADKGDSMLLRHDGFHVLIDGGYAIKPPFLNFLPEKLDAVVLTHGDADHVNGLLAFFNSLAKKDSNRVKELICQLPTRFRNWTHSVALGMLFQKFNKSKLLPAVQSVTPRLCHNHLSIYLISPCPRKAASAERSLDKVATTDAEDAIADLDRTRLSTINSTGICLLIQYEHKGKHHYSLITGDADGRQIVKDLELFQKLPGFFCATTNKYLLNYLDIPHHGSRNNHTEALLAVVCAKMMLISTKGSIHGRKHTPAPHPDVLRQLTDYLTDNTGCHLYFNYPKEVLEANAHITINFDDLKKRVTFGCQDSHTTIPLYV